MTYGATGKGGRRALLGVLLAVVLALGAGCGTTDPEYSPSIGVDYRGAEVDALSLTVVTNGDGVGTLVGTLLNHGAQPDRLVAVEARSPNQPPITTQLTHGHVQLPVEEPVQLAEIPAVTLTADSFRLGYGVDLRLDFAQADDITLRVLTAPQEGPFADVRVGADPS